MASLRKPAAQIFVLFAVYWITAKFGLDVSALNKFATIVWPPSGIAVAALLVFGTRLWPGIFLAAFAVNYMTGAPVFVAGGIATGNTLEALLAAYLCTRAPGFHYSLDRLQDVLRLVFRAAILSTIVAATVGVASLRLGGLLQADQLQVTWLQWWVGDGVGILTITPLLLAFAARSDIGRRWNLWSVSELIALIGSLAAVDVLIFTGMFGVAVTTHLKGPLIFPLLLWASMRFGLRGAVLSTCFTSAVAIWATTHGTGPFVGVPVADQLLQLVIFVLVIALINLVVAVIVTELIDGKAALAHALGARDLFFSVASHELKTPMTSLKLQLQLSQRALQKGSPSIEKLGEALDHSLRQVDSLVRLVNDLLDISTVHTGHFNLRKERLDLSTLVREVVERFTVQLEAVQSPHQLLLKDDLSGNWDRHRLEQIVGNLLSNAIKYAPGSALTVRTESRGNMALLTIADAGPGIDADKQARVFESFDRGSAPYQSQGLGLGLFIVKKIAEAHGGTVTLFSMPGQGSKFTIELPLG